MKRKVIIASLVLLLAVLLTACTMKTAKNLSADYSEAANLLTQVKTTQFFTDERVSDEDVEKILNAGINAPSAMNTQPWHFTAVTDEEVAQKLASAMRNMKPPAMNGEAPKGRPEGMPERVPGEGKMPPSGIPENAPKPPEGKEGFSRMPNKAGIGDAPLTIVISCEEGSEFSAGLAVQNMSAEAQLLGYGTKIMTAPTMSLNDVEYKELLSIPEGQNVVAVLIVGKAATDNPDAISSATVREAFDEVVTLK